MAVDEKFCTEVLLRNLFVNAPSHDEMGKLSVFLKTASEEDLQSLSKPDQFCAEVEINIVIVILGFRNIINIAF